MIATDGRYGDAIAAAGSRIGSRRAHWGDAALHRDAVCPAPGRSARCDFGWRILFCMRVGHFCTIHLPGGEGAQARLVRHFRILVHTYPWGVRLTGQSRPLWRHPMSRGSLGRANFRGGPTAGVTWLGGAAWPSQGREGGAFRISRLVGPRRRPTFTRPVRHEAFLLVPSLRRVSHPVDGTCCVVPRPSRDVASMTSLDP